MARPIRGVLAGIGVAFVLVLAIETVGMPLFPQPEGMDPLNRESVRQHLAQISPGSFAMVLLAWSVAAFAGPWIARRMVGETPVWPPLTVAALFALLCVYNLVVVPSPLWMVVAAIILIPLTTWLGLRAPVRRAA